MDDLTKKLGDLINSPEGMQKIQSALAAMGMGGDGSMEDEPAEAAAPMEHPREAGPVVAASHHDGLPDLTMLAKLAPLLQNFRKDDENTALLKALRPFLKNEREKRLDDTIKIMQFIKVMPLLQEKGLF